MAVTQVTFADKVKFQESPLAEINKLTDANINEIKNAINENATEQTNNGPGNDSALWTFDGDTTDSDPGAGRWKMNSATETAVTFLYVSKDNFNGVDYIDFLTQISTGTFIALQAKKFSKDIFLYETTGAVVDATSYVKIPVQFVSQGDNVAAGFVVNSEQYFSFFTVDNANGNIDRPLQWNVDSDSPIGDWASFQGHIEVDTGNEILDGSVDDTTYITSLDGGATEVEHADLSALDTWIDDNVTLATTKFLLKPNTDTGVNIGPGTVKIFYKIQ